MASIEMVLKSEMARMDKTRYQLSQETGINEGLLSRFIRGKAGISLRNAQVLLDHFGYEVASKRVKKGIERIISPKPPTIIDIEFE